MGLLRRGCDSAASVPGFTEDSIHAFVKKELADNQISDTEDLYDPITERMVPKILTGKQYIMKLEHQAGDKWSAVDEAASDQNGQPGKPGGHDSSKRIGYLDILALLSHGATENLADIQQYRSTASPDLWRRIRMGRRRRSGASTGSDLADFTVRDMRR